MAKMNIWDRYERLIYFGLMIACLKGGAQTLNYQVTVSKLNL